MDYPYAVGFLAMKPEESHNLPLYYIARNHIEHMTSQFTDEWPNQYPMYCEYGHVPLLSKIADAGHKHALIIKQGNMYNDLKHSMLRYWNEAYNGEAFVGHVLDRGNRYYDIHDQCYFIDLEWWDSIGRPDFSKGVKTLTTLEPHRSESNYHDKYTPKWVKKGDTERTYTDVRFGWNIIEAALDSPGGIGVWPQYVRHAKDYMYLESKEGYIENLGSVMKNVEGWYPFNTESFENKKTKNEYDIIIVPASGLSAVMIAYQKQLRPGSKIYVFDKSYPALQMTEMVHDNWNGKDYNKFAKALIGTQPDTLQSFCKGWGNLKLETHYPDGFEIWYEDVFSTYDIEYRYLDLWNWHNLREWLKDIRKKNPKAKIYMHVTNAFDYKPTSALLDIKTRLQHVRRYLDLVDELRMECSGKMFDTMLLEWMKIFPWYKDDEFLQQN